LYRVDEIVAAGAPEWKALLGSLPSVAPDAAGTEPDAAADAAGAAGVAGVAAVLAICRKKIQKYSGLLFSSFLFFL
jgi:hypothetical protein